MSLKDARRLTFNAICLTPGAIARQPSEVEITALARAVVASLEGVPAASREAAARDNAGRFVRQWLCV